MSADLSRVRFDPLRDHSGIGIQQGRLWLDADFNEQVAITDRRLRAQVADLAPTPTVVSRLTPAAFEITFSGGKLLIGAGRMYVDGLLAENHGSTITFDPTLAEPNGADPIEYGEQPYWPAPTALPAAGPHLVYLDVWERELDHLNTADLVDSAIGVDTTTRTQIAWQVRVMPSQAGAACDATVAGWDDLVVPSPIRLTTGTEEVDPVDDPCEIPPGSGYRGPENQLYRVELHSATQFKWSRDNATVAAAVAEVVSATSLRLESLGRDEVLSIKDGDWVEVTDDGRELSHAAGEMRQVTVDVATATIAFTPALPAGLTSTAAHLRVRKWDSGLVTIPSGGTAVALEHGITVTFSTSGSGTARPGDHWVFAARATAPTPDESLEKLVGSPPRGIHHHYARLAMITLPGTVNQDCRPGWPVADGEGCGCAVCVTPKQHNSGTFTVQNAVDQVKKAGGGTVTLCPGSYELDQPVRLDGATSLRIQGCGRGSRLTGAGTAIVVTRSQHITIEDLMITTGGDAPAVVLAGTNQSCRVERLWLKQKEGIALAVTGVQYLLSVRGCTFAAGTGVAASPAGTDSKGLLTYGLSIEDNVFSCTTRGIDFGLDTGGVIQHTGLTTIRGNTVGGCSDTGIVVTGLVPQDVEDYAGTLDICGNKVEVTGSGIVTGGRVRVSDNAVIAASRTAGKRGIVLDAAPPDTPDGVGYVLANTVSGFAGAGITVTAPMRGLIVKHNIVRGAGGGIVVQASGASRGAAIDNNQILDLRPLDVSIGPALLPAREVGAHPVMFLAHRAEGTGNPDVTVRAASPAAASRAAASPAAASRAAASPAALVAAGDEPTLVLQPPVRAAVGEAARVSYLVGIMLTGVEAVTVAGNTVDGVAADEQGAGQARLCAGIVISACVTGRVNGNTLSRIGHPDSVANSYGIVATSWQQSVSLSNNIVLAGSGPDPVSRPGWIAVALSGTFGGFGTHAVHAAAGTWVFAGDYAYLQAATAGHAELAGNTLHGGGEVPAVTVTVPGDVVLSLNQCAQPGTGEQPVVRLRAGTAVVHGNRLRGGSPSMTMDVNVDHAAVIGNVTTGGVQVSGTPVENTGKPWSPLNPIG